MQRKGDKNCCRKTQKEATTDTKRGSEREQRERETTRDRQIRREGFVLVSITCITCSTEESERERQRDREREKERERERGWEGWRVEEGRERISQLSALDIYRTWSIKLLITPKSLVMLPALHPPLFNDNYLVYRSIGPRFFLLIDVGDISAHVSRLTRCVYCWFTRRYDKQVESVSRQGWPERSQRAFHPSESRSSHDWLKPRIEVCNQPSAPTTLHPFQTLGRPRKWRHELAKPRLIPFCPPILHPTIERCSHLRGGARG